MGDAAALGKLVGVAHEIEQRLPHRTINQHYRNDFN
jgi:hypothetical protein